MDGTATARLESCSETKARLRGLADRPSTPLPAASVPDHFRRAAVLLLVGCHDASPVVVLTERAATMRSHASEIALPGGRLEPGETPEAAAVREAMEEVGVDPAAVELFGRLDEAWSKARNHVVPVVGWYGGALEHLTGTSPEVAAVFLTPLARIARPEAHRIHVAEIQGRVYENDVLDADGFDIYGLTADIVMDLLAWLAGHERDRIPARLAELERSLGPR
ncbi:MAG: NUDIX hydrolase [Acidimicrobiia bacterium]